jgi:hypothetical protein
MNLTEPCLLNIVRKFKGYKVYLGEDLKKTDKKSYEYLSDHMKTTSLKKANLIIENNVTDFCKPAIITDSVSKFPEFYTYKWINKQCNVACYFDEAKNRSNVYLIRNYYRLNNNPKLFDIHLSSPHKKKAINVNKLFKAFQGHRCLIVGGGPSWQTLNYENLAHDVVVMVVNYNFELRADYQIYSDEEVGKNLMNVTFKDNRMIIANQESLYPCAEFFFNKKEIGKCTHTGAYAVKIALNMGFDKVYLIGFDYKPYQKGIDYSYKKRDHRTYGTHRIKMFFKDFESISTEKVFNLSKISLLKKFKTVEVKEIEN